MSAKLFVPGGASDQFSGGEMSAPSRCTSSGSRRCQQTQATSAQRPWLEPPRRKRLRAPTELGKPSPPTELLEAPIVRPAPCACARTGGAPCAVSSSALSRLTAASAATRSRRPSAASAASRAADQDAEIAGCAGDGTRLPWRVCPFGGIGDSVFRAHG